MQEKKLNPTGGWQLVAKHRLKTKIKLHIIEICATSYESQEIGIIYKLGSACWYEEVKGK